MRNLNSICKEDIMTTMSKMIERTSLPHPEVIPKWLEGVETRLYYDDDTSEYTGFPENLVWVGFDIVTGFSFNIEQAYEKYPEIKDEIDYVLEKEEYTTQAVVGDYAVGAVSGKIKSTGGSSDYYKLTIHTASGETFQCEVGDVIQAMVGDNFQLGNVLKASRRMWLDAQGGGKVGVDSAYDANKIKYFVDDFVQRYGSKQ
jgi:hypothetical protein